MSTHRVQRTDWAEEQVEKLLAGPLISEFVFRGPKYLDKTEKEVIDFLLLHKGSSILISQKTQEEPDSRDSAENQSWVEKHVVRSLKPIKGVINHPIKFEKWCIHPRLGKVDFASIPPIVHAISIVETWEQVELSRQSIDLPVEYKGVPISYFSIHDFCNLVLNLRTIPELLKYLTERRSLPKKDTLTIGDEETLFRLYLLKGGTFHGCRGRADARRAIITHWDRVEEALRRHAEYVDSSKFIEFVADFLAERDPEYAEGLPHEALDKFDDSAHRKNYMILQGYLTDLDLRERAELGKAFLSLCEGTSKLPSAFVFQSFTSDKRPFVILVISARGLDKATIYARCKELTGAALSYFQKKQCLTIVEREGRHFDFALSVLDPVLTPEDVRAGLKYFGSLKIRLIDISRL